MAIVIPLSYNPTGYKLVARAVTGPASYTTGGFAVVFPELRVIHAALVVGGGGYKAEIASITANAVTIRVLYYDYAAAAAGPAIEVPAGTDLSGVTFYVLAIGE